MEHKRLIVILAGGLKQNKNGTWRTTTYDESGDTSGALGDFMRVVAGAYRYHDDPEHSLILASGGRGYKILHKDSPMLAEVIANELVEKGVPESAILKDVETNSSIEQLEYIATLVTTYPVMEIISNRYHIARLEAMVEHFDELKPLRSESVLFSSAEEIALAHDENAWKQIIETAYASGAMESRIGSEQQGIEHIKQGIYKAYEKGHHS